MERLSDKARMYARAYDQPPYGREVYGTAELLLQMADKLAEYEEFEEIFRTKMTDDACDFLKDKEEFAKWLDRNKWIAKKCAEYAGEKEQGKLMELPCMVGNVVWDGPMVQELPKRLACGKRPAKGKGDGWKEHFVKRFGKTE